MDSSIPGFLDQQQKQKQKLQRKKKTGLKAVPTLTPEPHRSQWLNDLWRLNVTTRCWHPIATGGKYVPTERSLFPMVVVGDYLWLFGGALEGDRQSNELWRININSTMSPGQAKLRPEWEPRVSFSASPVARERHAMTADSSGHLWVMGGITSCKTRLSKDHRLDYRNTYGAIDSSGRHDRYSAYKLCDKRNPRVLGDLWKYSIVKNVWTRHVMDHRVHPRYNLGLAFADNRLWVSGGRFNRLHVFDELWSFREDGFDESRTTWRLHRCQPLQMNRTDHCAIHTIGHRSHHTFAAIGDTHLVSAMGRQQYGRWITCKESLHIGNIKSKLWTRITPRLHDEIPYGPFCNLVGVFVLPPKPLIESKKEMINLVVVSPTDLRVSVYDIVIDDIVIDDIVIDKVSEPIPIATMGTQSAKKTDSSIKSNRMKTVEKVKSNVKCTVTCNQGHCERHDGRD